MLEVKPVSRSSCDYLILGVHYAKRWPSISYAFGLFRDGVMEGCVTFGTPPSATLRRGIAGEVYIKNVIELNRLVLINNIKNDASYLVSGAIRLLKMIGNFIIVSFADTEQGHGGTVYKACNFTYGGLSAKRTDWKIKGKEHLHGQTIADEFRGVKDRACAMREKYGDDFYLKPRSRKHKYIMVVGTKGFVARAKKEIRYKP
jgi:hypothetical protein